MRRQNHEKGTGKKALRRVLKYLKPQIPLLAVSCVLTAVITALGLLIPVLIGRGIDCITGPGQVRTDSLISILVQIAVCVLISAVCQWISGAVSNRLTYRTVMRIRHDAFHHLHCLPVSCLDTLPAGDTLARMVNDIDVLADGLLMGFSQFFAAILSIAGTLCFMAALSPWITAIVVLLTPLSLFASRIITGKTYRMFQEQSVTRGRQTALIEEMVGSQKLVHAFSYGDEALREFDDINRQLEKRSLRATFYSSLVNPVTRFVNALVYAAVAIAGALMILSGGGLTVGGLTTFLSYANQYTKPFNDLSGVFTELQNALACAGRVFEWMDLPPMTPDPEYDEPLNGQGSFELKHVKFSYKPSVPLIRDLSLSVLPGRHIAIVGPTGCGKTTLINLLMRFYDVLDGSVCMDGREIRELPRSVLRSQIGMVLQDTWLPAGTVREIISFGRSDASEQEIIHAAEAAHAHSFIRRLPQGYDTRIPENGGSLSQGQKQLLCIARVMLRLPPVLILDEATSSIDLRTEQLIQKAFEKMMKGRTTFVVAHRLSTIRNADRILVMRNGDVIEQGTHEELLRKAGAYAELYRMQFCR